MCTCIRQKKYEGQRSPIWLKNTCYVNTIPPIQKNGYGNYYVKTMATVKSYENKCAMNYSITNKDCNDAYNNKQLTKHDTNDDVDTLHLHFNGRVAYMH